MRGLTLTLTLLTLVHVRELGLNLLVSARVQARKHRKVQAMLNICTMILVVFPGTQVRVFTNSKMHSLGYDWSDPLNQSGSSLKQPREHHRTTLLHI